MDEVVVIVIIFSLIIGTPILIVLLYLYTIKHRIISEIQKLNLNLQAVRSDIENLKNKQENLIPVNDNITTPEEESTDIPDDTLEDINKLTETIPFQETDSDTISDLLEDSIPNEIFETNIIIEAPGQKAPDLEIISPPENKIKREKKDLEKLFGINLLSKIGIATLVLGIAYFVKYAIDQNWINEVGRVSIGILSGTVLIGIAHKLRINFRTFSSILIGGGISVLYITIALAFWDYELLSQTAAFSLLILITILSVFLSVVYSKKELAVFSLLGGFASPLIVSSGDGNYIVLFSYIFILNTGMLILAYIKRWKLVSILSYILTLAFYWVWLSVSFKEQYIGATIFGLLFFIQFYTLAMIDHFSNKTQKISIFQTFVILSNNLSFFCAVIYIFSDYKTNIDGIITISMAILNAIPLWIIFRDKKISKSLLYLLIAIVLSFVSLAIPVQLNGCIITMFWAVETCILLFLYRYSSFKIFRSGFFIIQALTLGSLFIDWNNFYYGNTDQHLNIIFNKSFITGVLVIATIVVNIFLIGNNKFADQMPENKFLYQKYLKTSGIILTFLVLFLELNYQLNYYFTSTAFINSVKGLYIYFFFAIYISTKWKNRTAVKMLIWASIILTFSFITIYMYIVYQVREETLSEIISGWNYFNIHYLSLFAISIFYLYLIKNRNSSIIKKDIIYWFLSISFVIYISLEINNIALMLFSESYPDKLILKYCNTIAYPILWGITSFILMIIGMKYKNRSLRIISLSLFALIIAKLYLYDIWKMNQTGRIIAFVFLGLLFLVVSFLYQKLKVLLQKEKKVEENFDE